VRTCLLCLTVLVAACNRKPADPAPSPTLVDETNAAPPTEVPDDAVLPVERRIEAISFLGDTLSEIPLDDAIRSQREQQFEEARLRWVADPTSIEAIVWAGRRAAYLGRYQEAILIFGLGLQQYPDEPRLYRHRGHRYITTRQLDSAVIDLERAAALIADQSDQIEPDGLPNVRNMPTSTLQSNIWYHLGLARFLSGDDAGALEAYRACLEVSATPDMEVATRYWLFLTLTRLGRWDEAQAVVEAVDPQWPLIENHTYHRLLLLYGGILPVDSLALEPTAALAVGEVTQAYGVTAWYQWQGNPAAANDLRQAILASGQWPAFGYLAAEAEAAFGQRYRPMEQN
jgi:tetratricopeptide (TPR) repeat protein